MKKIVNVVVAALLCLATVVSTNAQGPSEGRSPDDWREFEEKVSKLSPEDREKRGKALWDAMYRGKTEFPRAYRKDGSVPPEVADGLFYLFVMFQNPKDGPVLLLTPYALLGFCKNYCYNRRTERCVEAKAGPDCWSEASDYCTFVEMPEEYRLNVLTKNQMLRSLLHPWYGMHALLKGLD